MVVHKQIIISREYSISVPFGANILTAQLQNNDVVVWYSCEPTNVKVDVVILVMMTGEDFPYNDVTYINTVQWPNGMIGHVYVKN
jgi:hypothetical protein